MKVIHCESGPYGMGANVIGHHLNEAGDKTLCGKNVTAGGRWTRRYERLPLGKYDCKRCLKKGVKP